MSNVTENVKWCEATSPYHYLKSKRKKKIRGMSTKIHTSALLPEAVRKAGPIQIMET